MPVKKKTFDIMLWNDGVVSPVSRYPQATDISVLNDGDRLSFTKADGRKTTTNLRYTIEESERA